jgi:CRP-like cAMP-binding protein
MPAAGERVRQAVISIQGSRATDNGLQFAAPPRRKQEAKHKKEEQSSSQSTDSEPDAIDQFLALASTASSSALSASSAASSGSSSSNSSTVEQVSSKRNESHGGANKQVEPKENESKEKESKDDSNKVKEKKSTDDSDKVKDPILTSDMVHKCPLFSGLGSSAVAAIANKTTEQVVDIGNVVCKNGSDAREMFFVLSGEVEIRKGGGHVVATVFAGGFFGDIGVLFDGRRTADAVVSMGPCSLAVLTRADLESVVADFGCRDRVLECGQGLVHVRQWFVSRLPLFATCVDEPNFVYKVSHALRVRNAAPGEMLIRKGDEGCEMFFLFEGSVSITNRSGGGAALHLSAPNFFGELALLYSEPRSATVTCRSHCRLYVLDQDVFHSILQEVPNVINIIYSTVQEASNLKEHFIRKIPFFKSRAHDPEFIANVSLALQSESFKPNDFIVRQNAASDGKMFAIAHGHAEVLKVKEAGAAAVSVANLKAGDFFGEVALLLDTPRVASVVARGHCHVYTLSRDAFETLAVVYEDWWRHLISEQGALLKQVKSTGVAISAVATTQTHGLKLPHVQGTSASTMLSVMEPPVEKGNSVPDEKLCCVCRSAAKCMLSLPCSHIATCEDCHGMLKACPICRTAIEKGIKAFL